MKKLKISWRFSLPIGIILVVCFYPGFVGAIGLPLQLLGIFLILTAVIDFVRQRKLIKKPENK